MFYTARIYEDEGKFSVEFPDLDGCFTFGDTLEEALAMAKAARMGLSYQTLINTLVHRYLTGSVTFKEQF